MVLFHDVQSIKGLHKFANSTKRGFAMQKETPIFSFVLKDDSTIFIALLRKGPEQRCLQCKRKQRVFLFRY